MPGRAEIQHEAATLAEDVAHRDGVELQLRVGLNSGQVIAGEIGSGLSVTQPSANTSGWPSGWRRPPRRAVSCSARPPRGSWKVSRASANRELVQIKGADDPVSARRLLGIGRIARRARRVEPGRSAVGDVGCRGPAGPGDRRPGAVVGVVGPPGSVRAGSSREVRRDGEVTWSGCFHHVLRVAHQPGAVPRRRPAVPRGHRRRGPVDAAAARARSGQASTTPTPRRRCSSRICWASRDPRSPPPHRSGCASAAADRPGERGVAGHPRPRGLRHRGCALDRRVQRINARRLPHGGPKTPF